MATGQNQHRVSRMKRMPATAFLEAVLSVLLAAIRIRVKTIFKLLLTAFQAAILIHNAENMETSIPEIYNGVNNAMSTISNYSSYMTTLYALIAIVSFIWIIIDFKGTAALAGNLRNHFFTVFFIWVFFGSSAITSNVTVTLDNPDGSTAAQTYQMAPGFYYTTTVINSVTGWAKGAIGTISMNNFKIDVGKKPFAVEKYTMKLGQAQQMIGRQQKTRRLRIRISSTMQIVFT